MITLMPIVLLKGQSFGWNDQGDKNSIIKSNTPITSYISNINNAFIDNSEDLDKVMSNV